MCMRVFVCACLCPPLPLPPPAKKKLQDVVHSFSSRLVNGTLLNRLSEDCVNIVH